MATIDVYLDDSEDRERKRRRMGRIALVFLGIAGVTLATTKENAPRPDIPGPPPARQLLPLLRQYDAPIGPPPPPRAVIGPSRLDFGEHEIGTISPPRLITIHNDGGHPLEIPRLASTSPSFRLTSSCERRLEPRNTCAVALTFAPHNPGTHSASLVVWTDRGEQSIALAGFAPARLIVSEQPIPNPETAAAPQEETELPVAPPEPRDLLITPLRIHFAQPGRETITLANPDAVPVQITRIEMKGSAIGYEIGASACVKTLAPGEQCRIAVLATPAAIQLRERITVEILYDGARRSMRAATEIASR
jgi:hypothetical protein